VQNKQNKKQNKKEEKKKEEKKKAEMLMGFKFRIFIGHFQMTSWQ